MEFYNCGERPNPQFPFSEYLVEQGYKNNNQSNSGLEVITEEQLMKRMHDLEIRYKYLEKENTDLKDKLSKEGKNRIKIQVDQTHHVKHQSPKIQEISGQSEEEQPVKKSHKKRRTADMLNKNIACPYDRCSKHYASSLALNLHIRMKHNGGTKKQRKQILKAVIDAQLLGTAMPQINVNLPPNYIEEKKKILLGCQDFLKLGLIPPDSD